MGGSGSEELKKCPTTSPAVLWFVNGRERKLRKKKKNPIPYKEDAEWLKEVELELENVSIQENVKITKEDVTM